MNKRLGSTFVGIVISAVASASAAFADPASSSSPCGTGQELLPLKQVGMYLDGYHLNKSDETKSADEQHQIRTAHYCKQVSPDMFQCLLYDGNGADARVIGIEYVITDNLFKTLPASEQKYWHPHDSEVDTGLLILPGVKNDKQKEILGSLRLTHGKTWQVWPDLTQKVPMGEPILMWNVSPDKISSTTKKSVASRATDPTF